MVFPAGEISNMARILNVCGPISGALDDLFIQADGKENGALCLAFFGQCFLYLVFDPPTGDRMSREDQQQLIVLGNGLIDAPANLVSNLHIFWGKPAAYAFALQVGIQPVGKLLVTAGMANKAGVVLDGMSNQGVHIGEEVLWYTGFAQKCFRNVSLGAVDGINANARWAVMFYCLQSLHGAQIDISELCPSDYSTAEIGMVEVGKAEVGKAEVGIVEVGIAEGGLAEVGLGEVGKAEVGIAEVRLCCWMLLSPCIPNAWPLLQHFKLMLICHGVHLLCSALIIERCGYVCKHFFSCFSIGDASHLVFVTKCPCSLRHDTGKPCLSKYITACLPACWFKAHPSYAIFMWVGILLLFVWKVCLISPLTCSILTDELKWRML